MIKVLIADDEFWVREELKNIIPWNELGLEIVGKAEDGEEAIELIKSENPDILITDIKMPFYTGVEIIKYIKEHKLLCEVIAISGYDDFNYVKESILNGATDYLLKPIKESALTKVLLNVVQNIQKKANNQQEQEKYIQKIKEAREIMINNQFTQLVQGNTVYPQEFQDLLKEKQINEHINDYQIVNIKVLWGTEAAQERTQMIQGIESFITMTLSNVCGVYRNMSKPDELVIISENKILIDACKKVQSLIKSEYDLATLMGTVMVNSGVNGFLTGYKRASEAIGQINIDEHQTIKVWEQVETKKQTVEDFQVTEHTFVEFSKETFIKEINNYIINSKPFTIYNIKSRVKQIHERFKKLVFMNANQMKLLDEFVSKCMESAYKMNRCGIENTIQSIMGEFFNIHRTVQENQKHKNIDTIKHFIDEKYNNDQLSLAYLADIFYMNKEYISRRFKEVYGETLTEYIKKKRINRAMELLDNKSITITEIAICVGYSDYAYFNKVFKKETGMSPREYLKNKQESEENEGNTST